MKIIRFVAEILLPHIYARFKVTSSICENLELSLFLPRTQNVLGEKGRRIRELTAVVQKRFGFPEGSVEVSDSGICQR